MFKFAFYCTILFFLLSCKEQIDIKIEAQEATLVVSAEINNTAETYTVRLFEPTNYYNEVRNYQPKPFENAQVIIEDNNSKKHVFFEEFPGVYRSNPANFQGIIGQNYQLKIKLSNGDLYESSLEKIIEPVPITEVSYRFQDGPKLDSMRFDVSFKTQDNAQKQNFYLLKFNNLIHKFTTPKPCKFQDCEEIKSTCFELQISTKVKLFSDQFINGKTFGDRLTSFPANDITICETEVTQVSLSEKNYLYWQNLDDQSRTVGSIFDKIPAQIQGNIRCVNNPNKIALGNFFANGITKKKIAFNRYSEKRVEESILEIRQRFPLPVGDCVGNNVFTKKPKGW